MSHFCVLDHTGRGLAASETLRRLGLSVGMVHIASGNFVSAIPHGIRDGVDCQVTPATQNQHTSLGFWCGLVC